MNTSTARSLCGEGSDSVCPFLKVSYDDAFCSENGTPFLCRKGTVFVSEVEANSESPDGFCSGPPNYVPIRALAQPRA